MKVFPESIVKLAVELISAFDNAPPIPVTIPAASVPALAETLGLLSALILILLFPLIVLPDSVIATELAPLSTALALDPAPLASPAVPDLATASTVFSFLDFISKFSSDFISLFNIVILLEALFSASAIIAPNAMPPIVNPLALTFNALLSSEFAAIFFPDNILPAIFIEESPLALISA